MYTFDDLANELNVSVKTVRRRIKAEGIKHADKNGKALLFDEKALAALRDSLATIHHKHIATVTAGKANMNAKNSQAEKVKVQELLIQLDKTGRTLASDQYLSAIAEHVTDMIKNDSDIEKITSLLNNAISRAEILDNRYDDLIGQLQQLNNKVDHLYDKLVSNIKNFNYKQMAKINASEFLKVAVVRSKRTGSKG